MRRSCCLLRFVVDDRDDRRVNVGEHLQVFYLLDVENDLLAPVRDVAASGRFLLVLLALRRFKLVELSARLGVFCLLLGARPVFSLLAGRFLDRSRRSLLGLELGAGVVQRFALGGQLLGLDTAQFVGFVLFDLAGGSLDALTLGTLGSLGVCLCLGRCRLFLADLFGDAGGLFCSNLRQDSFVLGLAAAASDACLASTVARISATAAA